jgi:serine/threonine protein kinase
MQDLSGSRIGSYEVEERLGAGGMAVVYRAVQQPLGREVALKALMPSLIEDQGFLQRFELEAKTLARLDHPNILPIYDFVVTGEVVFLTMPLVRGGSLREVLNRGPLDGTTTWRYLREVGLGLQHAHDSGIIHRDLKPNNVLLHSDERALLADFGLARSANQDIRLTTAGFAIGTPGYMAPEQVLGQDLDHRVDIYAMGVMTFEMMTGQMPFGGSNAIEIAIATVNQPVPSACALNPGLPDELDAVLARAMAKEPQDRPDSVRELIGMLGKVPQRRSRVTAAVTPSAVAPTQTPPAPLTPAPLTPPPSAPIPSPTPTVAPAADVLSPAVTTLEQMGLPRLRPRNTTCAGWYFQSAIHSARDVAGPGRWPGIAGSCGVADYTTADPPGGEDRSNGIDPLSSITTVFEAVFAGESSRRLGEWGRRTTERALAARPSSAGEQRALKLLPGRRRLGVLLKGYIQSLDGMRGEPAHAWREVDANRYWVVHYQNPYALGRRRAEKSCHFWIASYEAMLRWAALANDWLVDEIECGCVTGSGDCVFAIRSTKA